MTLCHAMLAPNLLFGGDSINRRGFLKSFLQGAVYLPLMPGVPLVVPGRRVLVQQSPIAGFQYYDGEHVFSRLHLNTSLRLARDAENKYDKNAVAVYIGEQKLGFVLRADKTAIAQMIDNGEHLETRIVHLEQSKNPWDRIRFKVTLNV